MRLISLNRFRDREMMVLSVPDWLLNPVTEIYFLIISLNKHKKMLKMLKFGLDYSCFAIPHCVDCGKLFSGYRYSIKGIYGDYEFEFAICSNCLVRRKMSRRETHLLAAFEIKPRRVTGIKRMMPLKAIS